MKSPKHTRTEGGAIPHFTQDYQQALAALKALKPQDPGFQQAWAQLETIKNQNRGFVPHQQ